MPKERFLVIGSNSFSGSHFIKRLIRNGYFTHGVSRSEQPNLAFLPYLWEKKIFIKDIFKFTKINLNKDIEQLIEIINIDEITHVVNFAAQGMVAQSWVTPEDWYKTNVVSQVEFHNRLRLNKNIAKYVHITTPEVYGDTKGWIKEKDIFDPSTPYAVSRAACDLHLKSFFKAYDFPVVFTRAANVYGPGQQLYRIIPRSFLSALTGKKMDLHGGGSSIRSFIHIDDVTKATLMLALEGEPGTTWHLSTTKSISIFDLVKKIFSITNSDFDDLVNIGEERLGKDQSYLLDSIKMRKRFNWSDKITLEEGLTETKKWVSDNLSIFENFNWDYQHKK
tara:strand:+ start:1812 stop:2816 length:1005 start_codon:yes stop_codon:yes gene_type:complete